MTDTESTTYSCDKPDSLCKQCPPVYDQGELGSCAANALARLFNLSAASKNSSWRCGYDDKAQRFIIRNSWGNKWGLKGYFTMPYPYLSDSNLADDLWTIRLVTQ